MTDPKNPLMARTATPISRKPFVTVERTGEQVPTDIEGYCAWLNEKEWRRGEWVLDGSYGQRTVDWKPEIATDDWLIAKGLSLPRCPSPEKRAIIAERLRDEKRREEERDKRRE